MTPLVPSLSNFLPLNPLYALTRALTHTHTHTHTHTLPAHSITCPHLYTHKYAPTLCLLSHTTHTLFLTQTSSCARTFFSRSIQSILASSGTYYLQVYNKDTVMVSFDSRLSRSLCLSLSVSHSLFIFCTHPIKHIRMSRHAHTHTRTQALSLTHTHTHTHSITAYETSAHSETIHAQNKKKLFQLFLFSAPFSK